MSTLTENEIRPDDLMPEQEKMLSKDIKRLMQRQGEFVSVSCPACRRTHSRTIFEKYGLNYDICLECSTVFINPRPTPEILEDYYSHSLNYKYWSEYIFPASEEARRDKIFHPRVEKIIEICTQYKIEPESLLEVGAGFGTFCEEMRKQNYFRQIIAIEPTPELAKSCRSKGLRVIEMPVEKVIMEEESINVIVSFEVIEHLFCPDSFINSCKQFLKTDGLLILSCPNIQGFDIALLKELSKSIDNEHLNYFNPNSLSYLLTNNGFDILEILTPGSLDAELVRTAVLDGKYDLANQPFLETLLINRWEELGQAFQTFLVDNKLSSHLWIVARKK